jgi:hypothetical protein
MKGKMTSLLLALASVLSCLGFVDASAKFQITGEWSYHSGHYSVLSKGGQLSFSEKIGEGNWAGTLHRIGDWFQADVKIGTIRLKPGELGTLVSQYKDKGSDEWGKPIVAHRTKVAVDESAKFQPAKFQLTGEWSYDSGAHHYNVFSKDGKFIFYEHVYSKDGKFITRAEGALHRIGDWFQGDVKVGLIRLKPGEDGTLVSQFKRKLSDEWGSPLVSHRTKVEKERHSIKPKPTERKKEEPQEVKSASADWQAKAKAITAAYNAFFDDFRFKKGWKQLPFSREEVATPLGIAAGIVAQARNEIDARDKGITLWQTGGSAIDWMHSPESHKLLQDDTNRFIAGLVHATFRDGKGYVKGLDEKQVDIFIERYRQLSV